MYRVLLLVMSILITGCSEHTSTDQKNVYVYILDDESDEFEIEPTAKWLEQLKPWARYSKIKISHEVLDDVPYHGINTINYEGAEGVLSNEVENKQRLKIFIEEMRNQLIQIDSAVNESSKSILYPVVVDHLNRAKADEIHLFSDLRENSFINLYNYKNILELRRNYQEIQSAFEQIELKEGKAKIYLYHKIEDYDSGMEFQFMIQLYKSLLEPKGYEVLVGNINPLTS